MNMKHMEESMNIRVLRALGLGGLKLLGLGDPGLSGSVFHLSAIFFGGERGGSDLRVCGFPEKFEAAGGS